MHLQVMSDLHFEFDGDCGRRFARSVPVEADVLVLAGDIFPLEHADDYVDALEELTLRFGRVFHVNGNHEYYGLYKDPTTVGWDLQSEVDLIDINREYYRLSQDRRIVGATLWYDSPQHPYYQLADSRRIPGFDQWVAEMAKGDYEYLSYHIQPGDVVVTHHMPHVRSVAPAYKGNPYNRYFVHYGAQALVEERGVALWIHGHTHTPCDYTVNGTRVVCNPRGYPSEHSAFNPAFVVEV